MKKIIVSAFALTMLGSSAAFADADRLSAFQGVETQAVSASELNQVSGEGLLGNLLGIGTGVLGDVLNGNLVNNVLGLALGTVGNLGLLEGLTVDSGTVIQTGGLVSGATGINQIVIGASVN